MRIVSMLFALAVVGCGDGPPAPAAPAGLEKAAPYPLKTCVVSGEELGKMGKPHRIVHAGREVLFCCAGCEKDFNKDPHKYMMKIVEAAKKPEENP